MFKVGDSVTYKSRPTTVYSIVDSQLDRKGLRFLMRWKMKDTYTQQWEYAVVIEEYYRKLSKLERALR